MRLVNVVVGGCEYVIHAFGCRTHCPFWRPDRRPRSRPLNARRLLWSAEGSNDLSNWKLASGALYFPGRCDYRAARALADHLLG